MKNRTKSKRRNLVVAAFAIIMVFQLASFANAVSGSDTPSYPHANDWTTGLWGDKYANADETTGKLECYAYIYSLSCDAGAEVFAHQTVSGSYRWRVEVEVSLKGYINNVGALSGNELQIYIKLLDSDKNFIVEKEIYNADRGSNTQEIVDFDTDTFTEYFSQYRTNVRYIGVTFFVASGNGGKVCQDADHQTINDPAYVIVSSISWSNY